MKGTVLLNNKEISLENLNELISISPLSLAHVKFIGEIEIDREKYPFLFALLEAEKAYLENFKITSCN